MEFSSNKNSAWRKGVISMTIFLLFALPYFYQQRLMAHWQRTDFFLLSITGTFFAIYKSCLTKIRWTPSFLILAVAGLYILIQTIFWTNHDLSSYNILILFLSLLSIYAVLKECDHLHVPIFVGVYLLFIGMVLLGIFQVIQFRGDALSITGWMMNSGYYSNFLGSILPVLMAVMHQRKIVYAFHKWMLAIFIFLGVLLVFLTQSRASIVGLVLSSFFIYWSLLKKYLHHWSLVGMLVLFCAIGITGMYFIKPISFLGRWMIYKVSWSLWQEHPWIGVGPGRLGVFFNSAQAAYWQKHDATPHALQIVDDTTEAFNIFLQVGVEFGWIGIVLMFSLVALIYKHWKIMQANAEITVMQKASLAGLVGIVGSSLFSNPLHMPVLNLLAILYLACIFKNEKAIKLQYIIPQWVFVNITMIIMVVVFCFVGWQSYYLHQWKLAARAAIYQNFTIAQAYYKKANEGLQHDGAFLYNYGAEAMLANESQLAIRLLSRATLFCDASQLYVYRGQAYLQEGASDLAVADFRKAYAIVPSLLYPRYLLWKVFKKYGPSEQEIYWRNLILNHPPKINTVWSAQWMEEVRSYYQLQTKFTANGKDPTPWTQAIPTYRDTRK